MIKNPDIKSIKNAVKKYKRKFARAVIKNEYPVLENINIINSFVLPSTYTVFRLFNKYFFLNKMLKKIDSYQLKNPVVIWYIPNKATLEIIEYINPSILIYDCVSNYTGLKGVPRDTSKIEDDLIKKSDILIADSDFLVNKLRTMKNNVHQIMPGVNYDLFSEANTGVVKDIKTVCYFGGIRDDRIDIELLLNLTKKLKDRQFLIIGPVNSPLPEFPENTQFTGRVPHKDLPSYLKKCDCIILPYRINEFTEGIIPAKFFEAFASGKPVIATSLSNFRPYSDVMILAETAEEFSTAIKNIEEFENKDKYKKRLAMAQQKSWDMQCRSFLNLIVRK